MRVLAVAILLMAASPAAARDPVFTPKPGENHKVEVADGRATTMSHSAGSDVRVGYVQMFTSKRPLFEVTITNLDEYAVDIDPANVAVTYAMQPVHIYSPTS